MSRYNKYNEDGYRVIDGRIDPYVIRIDTGDGNVDYTANMLCDNIIKGEYVLPNESSLIWLAKTQGYSRHQLEDVLAGKETNSVFLKSVYDEVMNCESDIRQLVFLINLNDTTIKIIQDCWFDDEDETRYDDKYEVYEWFDYETVCKPKLESVKLRRGTTCGLVNLFNGGGSILGIELEHDIEIPAKYIHDIESDYRPNYYPIWDIYGIDVSAFDSCPEFIYKEE